VTVSFVEMFGPEPSDSESPLTNGQHTGTVCEKHPELKGKRTKKGNLCVGCKKVQVQNWRNANKEETSDRARQLRVLKRKKVIEHFGGKCELCGLVDDEVMTVDHIWDDGAEHRKQVKATVVLDWLIKNDYPPGYRLLCFNCNHKAHQVFRQTGNPPMSLYTIQREISRWADIQFPERDATSVANKLKQEMAEWQKDPDDAAELADVLILVLDWAYLKGVDMQQAINQKMVVNLSRNWIFNAADRTWQHT